MTTIPIDEMINKECSKQDYSQLSLSDLKLAYDLYEIAIKEHREDLALYASAKNDLQTTNTHTKLQIVKQLKQKVAKEIIKRI